MTRRLGRKLRAGGWAILVVDRHEAGAEPFRKGEGLADGLVLTRLIQPCVPSCVVSSNHPLVPIQTHLKSDLLTHRDWPSIPFDVVSLVNPRVGIRW